MLKYIRLVTLVLVLNAAFFPAAYAQFMSAPAKSEADTAKTETVDALGRTTPRGTFKGFFKAVTEEDYEQASLYLDLSKLPRSEQTQGIEYAKNLQTLLERAGRMPPDGTLSDSPEGQANDDLAPDLDKIAGLKNKTGTLPIYVQRIDDHNGQKIWLISSDFVKTIPELLTTIHETPIDKIFHGKFENYKIQGTPATHWLVMILLYIAAYFISSIFVKGLLQLGRKIIQLTKLPIAQTSESHFIDAFEFPLRLYTMIVCVIFCAIFLGVSAIVRHIFMPINLIIIWFSIGLFFWRLTDIIFLVFARRMATRGRHSMSSLLSFLSRGIKFFLAIVIAIITMDALGIDVTAGLAALGIGGIALALGAQKTLENFIGSLSIIADQPFYIGDYCKIGDTAGNIEDIGMRSTRIRTNEWTVVTIPNGDLSTQRVENFARRSRFLMNQKFFLRYDATSAQIKDFVSRSVDFIKDQPKVIQEGRIVRLMGFADSGYRVDIWCYVKTRDYTEFLEVQANITLGLIDAADSAGVYFAIPSQTFVPAVDQTGAKTGPAQQD